MAIIYTLIDQSRLTSEVLRKKCWSWVVSHADVLKGSSLVRWAGLRDDPKERLKGRLEDEMIMCSCIKNLCQTVIPHNSAKHYYFPWMHPIKATKRKICPVEVLPEALAIIATSTSADASAWWWWWTKGALHALSIFFSTMEVEIPKLLVTTLFHMALSLKNNL